MAEREVKSLFDDRALPKTARRVDFQFIEYLNIYGGLAAPSCSHDRRLSSHGELMWYACLTRLRPKILCNDPGNDGGGVFEVGLNGDRFSGDEESLYDAGSNY